MGLVEGSPSTFYSDLLLTFMDDITVFTIWQAGVEGHIVEVAHGKEALLPAAESQTAILHLPVFLGGASNNIGKLKQESLNIKWY